MTDDAHQPQDPGPDDAVPDRPGSTKRTVPAAAFVMAVMVAALLGILAVVALSTGGDGSEAADDARFAAARFGERFLTFRHDELDEWKADVLSMSTGGFANEVEDVEQGLRRLIAESEIDATTQVTEIFLGEVDQGTVGAVLLYDRDITGADGPRTESDRYMQLELTLVDGEWLVDNVIDISTAGGLTGGQAPPATTGTSAPATPTTTVANGGE